MLKSKLNITLIIISVFSIWIYWFIYSNTHNKTYYTVSKFIADFDNINKVAWFSDNIFEWLIVNVIWNAPLEEWWITNPQTIYEVKVLKNIKWNLTSTWTISIIQEWWYDEKWNLIIEKNTSLLSKWNTYILSTKTENPYRLLNHKNWAILIKDKDKNLDTTYEKRKLKEYKNAYKNEELYEWNLEISSFKNIYKNLNNKEKNNLENIYE